MSSVLFTGYAPVHYACFRPLHAELERIEGVDVRVAGGTRRRGDDGEYVYDADAMYGPFGIDGSQTISPSKPTSSATSSAVSRIEVSTPVPTFTGSGPS